MPEVRVKLKHMEDIYIIPNSNPTKDNMTIISYASENSYKKKVLVDLTVPSGVMVLRTKDIERMGGLDKILKKKSKTLKTPNS